MPASRRRLVAACAVTAGAVVLLGLHGPTSTRALAAALATSPSSRPLLPLLPSSALALAAALALCALASAAGIGGGAALVPLYLTLAGQGAHAAVALSNLTILGSAASAFALNARRWHAPPGGAAPPRPLVDWDVILLMEPATIVGAVAGALLNAVAPPAATLGGLAALLVFVTHSVAAKAAGAWAAETAVLERALEQDGGEAGSSLAARLLPDGDGDADDDRRPKPVAGEGRTHGQPSGPDSPKPPEPVAPAPPPPPPPPPALPPPRLPAAKVGALVALFGVVLAANGLKARLACGSARYWAATLAPVPAAVGLTAWARRAILAGAGTGGADDLPDAQLAWTRANTLTIPAVSALAGVAAGAFGVGGGIIKGPFLILVARLPPEVAAASAMTMILFTSATASLEYLAAGAADPAWGGAGFGVGLLGAAAGVAGLARAIAATGGRRSLVMVAMAATLGVSLVATVWEAGAAARRGEVGRGRLC